MTDEKDDDGKTIRARNMTLSLKKTVDAGHIQQSFSAGRKKSVVVEVKKKRFIAGTGGAPARGGQPAHHDETDETKLGGLSQREREERAKAKQPRQPQADKGGDNLSSTEMDARARALQLARERDVIEAEQRKREEEERAERDRLAAIERAEREQREAEQRETGTTEPVMPPAAGPTEAEAPIEAKPAIKEAPATERPREAKVAPKRPPREEAEAEERDHARRPPVGGARVGEVRREREKVPVPVPAKLKSDSERRSRKLTIQNALDEGGRQRSLASLRRQQQKQKRAVMSSGGPDKISREVILPEAITIQELANRMTERAVDVIKYLMKQGQMMKMNDVIDADTAELIATDFGHTVKRVSEADVEEGFIGSEDPDQDLKPRAPVVTIMGHVDHGKTSLLDAIREANVVAGEAGGITQHIGAYQVDRDGQMITFIDTPGHADFTEMRARGAKVTDIVVLVVAANDGVMPQTVEALNHAKAAGVPIIVAINKIDLPEANPTRVRTDLLQHEIVVESMGGETLEVEVSAKKRINLEGLLDAILMQAEILELKANPERSAEGYVIEAQLERGRGPVATLLVQRGTLKVGNIIVAGTSWGRIRALVNDKGDHVKDAGPAVPVEALGLDSAPLAGDQFAVVENEARAREITEYRERKRRDMLSVAAGGRSSLEQMMRQLKEAGRKEFPIIIKGDVQGSIEAISGALEKLGTEEVIARIVHSAVGGINESDIQLATAANAVILAFNVRANSQAKALAEREGIEIRYYSIIYDLVDDVKSAMSGLLAPEKREHFLGYAEILEVFNITKVGKVAGCRVTDGRVERGAGVRLIRDNVVVHEGKLSTLKRFKDEVKEVQSGQECGMAFENYQDIRPGDQIECFHVEMVERAL
jgi:translation initiation factor IF-2